MLTTFIHRRRREEGGQPGGGRGTNPQVAHDIPSSGGGLRTGGDDEPQEDPTGQTCSLRYSRSTIQGFPNAAYPALRSSVMIRTCHMLVAIALIIMTLPTVRIVGDDEAYA